MSVLLAALLVSCSGAPSTPVSTTPPPAESAAAACDRGEACLTKDDSTGAIREFSKAIAADPKCGRAWRGRGQARGFEDFENALRDFEEALRIDPRDVEAMKKRGNVKLNKGDAKAALEDYEATLRIDPNYAHGWLNRAAADYTESLRLRPDFAKALLNRAQCRHGLEDWAGAISDLDLFVKAKPQDPEGWKLRGACKWTRKDVEGSLADYRKSLEVAPMDCSGRAEIEKWLEHVDKRK